MIVWCKFGFKMYNLILTGKTQIQTALFSECNNKQIVRYLVILPSLLLQCLCLFSETTQLTEIYSKTDPESHMGEVTYPYFFPKCPFTVFHRVSCFFNSNFLHDFHSYAEYKGWGLFLILKLDLRFTLSSLSINFYWEKKRESKSHSIEFIVSKLFHFIKHNTSQTTRCLPCHSSM